MLGIKLNFLSLLIYNWRDNTIVIIILINGFENGFRTFRRNHVFSSYVMGDEWSVKMFKLLGKFYLCSICSQDLNECSLARAPQIFAVARMLAFLSVLLEIL